MGGWPGMRTRRALGAFFTNPWVLGGLMVGIWHRHTVQKARFEDVVLVVSAHLQVLHGLIG